MYLYNPTIGDMNEVIEVQPPWEGGGAILGSTPHPATLGTPYGRPPWRRSRETRHGGRMPESVVMAMVSYSSHDLYYMSMYGNPCQENSSHVAISQSLLLSMW